jgi:hypothetical protein
MSWLQRGPDRRGGVAHRGGEPSRAGRSVKWLWALVMTALAGFDLLAPSGSDLDGWHRLVDRCLGRGPERDESEGGADHGHLVPRGGGQGDHGPGFEEWRQGPGGRLD